MGYQLFMLTLWAAPLLSPYHALLVAGSTVASGGLALIHCHAPAPFLAQVGGAPFTSGHPPLELRSAGSWKIKIAFGLTGFAPGAVGGTGPRANPSANHSPVTPT